MSDDIRSDLSGRLRQLRLSKHLTQRELGAHIDRHGSYISAIETGKKLPPVEMLVKIADVLDTSADVLLGLTGIDEFDLSSPSGIVRISKYIEFPPEHYQAGLSILSYFGTVLRQQSPDTKAMVRIEQEGLAVRLVIESPSGERQVVEKTLHEYGLVVTGQIKPQQLLHDPQHVVQLESKLEIASMEMRMLERQLEFERDGYRQRMSNLEDEVEWLRTHIGRLLSNGNNDLHILVGALNRLAAQHETRRDDALASALSIVSQVIEKGESTVDPEDVRAALEEVQKKRPNVFNQIRDFALNALSSSTGSYLYEIAVSIAKGIPQ